MDNDGPTYTAEQAAVAANALRRAAGLGPEAFPQGQFVGMLSDEIRLLRERGLSDEEIANIIAASGAPMDADTVRRMYVDTSGIQRQA